MTARLTVLSLVIACVPLQAAEDAFNPFSRIVRRGEVIIATLAPHHRWAVAVGSSHSRAALDGESFQLTDGERLFLAELQDKRLIYRIRGHLSPLPAGVQVEDRFDARTFTDMRVKKAYFLEAL
jgi:hypothetical protein